MTTTVTIDRMQSTPSGVDMPSIGLLVLRVFTGSAVMLHGLQQVHRMDDFANNVVRGLNVPFPVVAAWLTMLGEIGLGALLVLGLFTRPAGALLGMLFIPIFFTYYVFGPSETLNLRPNSGTLRGIETISFAAAGLMLSAAGAGRFALDRSPLRQRLPLRSLDKPLHQLGDLSRTLAFARFRVFAGCFIVLHGILQLEKTSDFTTRLGEGIGWARPTLVAWTIMLATIAVGLLLAFGAFVRTAGFVLTGLMLVTCLSVRSFGGGVFDIGFDGEEYLIYASMGVFFGCVGTNQPYPPRRQGAALAAG